MVRDVVRMRQFALRKYDQGWSGDRVASALQVPRRTVYFWLGRYQNCDKEQMHNKVTRGEMPVDDKTRKYIVGLRKKWNWGPNKIEGYIRTYAPGSIQKVSHSKIYAVLVKEGLNLPIDFVRKTWGKKRFCRSCSNSLWQTDFKLLDNDNWICSYLDDHSRFITNAREFSENPTTEIALEILMKAMKKHEHPEQVLTDQGTEFYCAPAKGKKQGTNTFTKTLDELGIKHIVASKRRPTTIGKIEAFHKGVQYEAPKLEMNFKKYTRYWNNQRPHQELKYKFPSQVYLEDNKKGGLSATNQS